MKWNHLLAGLVVAFGATACLAETPDFSAEHPQAMSLMQRGRLLGGLNWWNRYGEPVNATALAQAEASPSDKGPGAMPVYGDGYIFGPGSCDCPPPCIGNLWTGYFQDPWRCNPDAHKLFHRCGHCGACGMCGKGCCSSCGKSCGAPVSCGCAAPVSCTTAAPGCGCKPVCGKCRTCHFGHWKGLGAHWHKPCKSCASPVSCGCATPVITMPGSEKQADEKYPSPLPAEPVLYSLPRLN